MAVVAFMEGGLSFAIRETHDRATPVFACGLSMETRHTHDRETQRVFESLSVQENLSPSADALINSLSMRHAGVIDAETGDRTPFYGVEGDISDTV